MKRSDMKKARDAEITTGASNAGGAGSPDVSGPPHWDRGGGFLARLRRMFHRPAA